MDRCLGLVEDLAFATMFENDNILEPQLCVMNIAEEIDSVVSKLSTLDDYRSIFSTLSIEVVVDPSVPTAIIVDKALLRVLHNLISNAARFTPVVGGKVVIAVAYQSRCHLPKDTTTADSPSYSTITTTSLETSTEIRQAAAVQDGTLSINLKNSVECEMDLVAVNKAFQHYYDADSRSMANTNSKESLLTNSLTATQGVGLGLYVSYNIVQIMGGLLECSAASSESAFWFTIPVKCDLNTKIDEAGDAGTVVHNSEEGTRLGIKGRIPSCDQLRWTSVTSSCAAAQHVLLSHSSGEGLCVDLHPLSKRKRILVVDDSPICQKILIRILRANDYDADVASNGKVCLARYCLIG